MYPLTHATMRSILKNFIIDFGPGCCDQIALEKVVYKVKCTLIQFNKYMRDLYFQYLPCQYLTFLLWIYSGGKGNNSTENAFENGCKFNFSGWNAIVELHGLGKKNWIFYEGFAIAE